MSAASHVHCINFYRNDSIQRLFTYGTSREGA